MDRRLFMGALGGASMLSAMAGSPAPAAEGSGRKTKLYRLEFFYLRAGDQVTRLNQFFASQMPTITKHIRTVGVFNALVAPGMPATLLLAGFSGFDEMASVREQMRKDPGYMRAREELDKGTEPPFDRADEVLLEATDFSPEIVPLKEKPKTPRVFELRVYHSPTQRQLGYVLERFAGPEIKIFHRVGVHPILYTTTILGPNMPNLTYLIPFDSLADREKAWDAFQADPDWIKARDESIARGGQIVANQNISLFRAAPFSPIQ